MVAVMAPTSGRTQTNQTVEGATAFLGLLAGRNDLQLDWDCQEGENPCRTATDVGEVCLAYWRTGTAAGLCRQAQSGTERRLPTMRITSAETTIRCRTRFSHRDYRLVNDDHQRAGDATIEEFGPEAKTFQWDRISSVRVAGDSVFFDHPSHWGNAAYTEHYKFLVSSPDMAARVGYALEFLRTNCDATAQTGF
jgi:hypothetical protein